MRFQKNYYHYLGLQLVGRLEVDGERLPSRRGAHRAHPHLPRHVHHVGGLEPHVKRRAQLARKRVQGREGAAGEHHAAGGAGEVSKGHGRVHAPQAPLDCPTLHGLHQLLLHVPDGIMRC